VVGPPGLTSSLPSRSTGCAGLFNAANHDHHEVDLRTRSGGASAPGTHRFSWPSRNSSATRATPTKSGRVPARLLLLRQLLRALQERHHPRSLGENRHCLPTGLLQLWQLLRQQPKQQPGSDPEAGEFLPAGLVQLWWLLREEPLSSPLAQQSFDIYSLTA
jgi:hypothetical protein